MTTMMVMMIFTHIPHAPCTGTAPTGSSIANLSISSVQIMATIPPITPMINASYGLTTAQEAAKTRTFMKVKVSNSQEMAQSERNFIPKTKVVKTKLTYRYLYQENIS